MPLPAPVDYVAENSRSYLQYTEFNKSPVHRVRLACIISMLEKSVAPAGGKVLEVGCGTGNIAIPIASLGYEMTACDIHAPSIGEASGKNPFPNLKFLCGSLGAVNPAEYKAIVLTEVLEHVPACRDMLAAISGSMRSDAALIVTVPNGWGVTELMCRPSYALKKIPGGSILVKRVKAMLKTEDLTTGNLCTPHVNFFTLGRLARLFGVCGMEVASFSRCFFLWPLWETFLSKRGCPAAWPENDFRISQSLPPAWCSFWCMLLKKSTGCIRGS